MSMRAVIIGGVAWNTMLDIGSFPDPTPQTLFASDIREAVGSSGAGKALNFRSLGGEVVLWSLLGDDEPASRVREVLAAAGVDYRPKLDPEGTMRHVNLMDDTGERISIFANSGSDTLDVDTTVLADVLADADVISVTIMNHCRQFLPAVADSPGEVWIDLHDYDGRNPHHAEFIEAADCLMMSSIGMPGWRRFLEDRIAAGNRIGICTHGAEGASGISGSTGWIEVDAVPVERVVDTNGAGDAFWAGMVTSLVGGDLEVAMAAGAEHAARAVASPGLAPGVGLDPE